MILRGKEVDQLNKQWLSPLIPIVLLSYLKWFWWPFAFPALLDAISEVQDELLKYVYLYRYALEEFLSKSKTKTTLVMLANFLKFPFGRRCQMAVMGDCFRCNLSGKSPLITVVIESHPQRCDYLHKFVLSLDTTSEV